MNIDIYNKCQYSDRYHSYFDQKVVIDKNICLSIFIPYLQPPCSSVRPRFHRHGCSSLPHSAPCPCIIVANHKLCLENTFIMENARKLKKALAEQRYD